MQRSCSPNYLALHSVVARGISQAPCIPHDGYFLRPTFSIIVRKEQSMNYTASEHQHTVNEELRTVAYMGTTEYF